MNKAYIRHVLGKRLSLKMLCAIIAVIIVVLSAFTLFGVVREGNKVKAGLKDQGDMLAKLLSHSAVVGVYAENRKLLKDSTESVLRLKDVLSVSIYNIDLKVLYSSHKSTSGKGTLPIPPRAIDARESNQTTSSIETREYFEFIRPVILLVPEKRDEDIYFNDDAAGNTEKAIGYVRVVLSKEAYHKEVGSVIAQHIIIMLIFIFMSAALVYVAVKKITRPLENLTDKVKDLEKGLHIEPMPVESGDEVGNLASAFNSMVDARTKIEEKIQLYQQELYFAASEMSSMQSRIEERERNLIAADLHDYVGQNLVVSQFKLGLLRKALSSPADIRQVEDIKELIAQTTQYTRLLTIELSPPILVELGLTAAVAALAEGLQKTHGLLIKVEDDEKPKELESDTRYLLFRSVRELLMNIIKHADTNSARISFAVQGGFLRTTIEDKGRGFDPESVSGKQGGFGLFTIRERLKRMGGACEIASRPGAGTTVVLTAPLNEKDSYSK